MIFIIYYNRDRRTKRANIYVTKDKIYLFGIVNILSVYGAEKQMMHLLEKMKFHKEEEMSVINAHLYQKRFLNCINHYFHLNHLRTIQI